MALLWLKHVAAHTIARAEMMLAVQAETEDGLGTVSLSASLTRKLCGRWLKISFTLKTS